MTNSIYIKQLVSICCRTTSGQLCFELLMQQSCLLLSELPDFPSLHVQIPPVLLQNWHPCYGRYGAPATQWFHAITHLVYTENNTTLL